VKQPTVYLVIGSSAIAFEANSSEILETVEWDKSGKPDWTNAGVCDSRGGGGIEGYHLLYDELYAAEDNAKMIGYELTRVPYPWGD
jgi:hypothetical protein